MTIKANTPNEYRPGTDGEAMSKRYVFHCVAPGVTGGPSPTDDLDRALLETASWIGSHWDIYDTVEKRYVQPIGSEEEEAEVRARYEARCAASSKEERTP